MIPLFFIVFSSYFLSVQGACSTLLVRGSSEFRPNAMGIYYMQPEKKNSRYWYLHPETQMSIWHLPAPVWVIGPVDDDLYHFAHKYAGSEVAVEDNKKLWKCIEMTLQDCKHYVVECLWSEDDYWLRMGHCNENLIGDLVDTSRTDFKVKECATICKNDYRCAGFSVSDMGCFPQNKSCEQPKYHPGGSYTYTNSLVSYSGIGRPAFQSSELTSFPSPANNAIDGDINADLINGRSCSHTDQQNWPWWAVDIGQGFIVRGIIIRNRADCCASRLQNVSIYLMDGDETLLRQRMSQQDLGSMHLCNTKRSALEPGERLTIHCQRDFLANMLVILLPEDDTALSLCEVEPLLQPAYNYHFFNVWQDVKSAEETCQSAFGGGHLLQLDNDDELSLVSELYPATDHPGEIWTAEIADDDDDKINGTIPDYPIANIAPESGCKSSTEADTLRCSSTIDGQSATRWAPEVSYVGEWMEITLNQKHVVYAIRVMSYSSPGVGINGLLVALEDGFSQNINLPDEMETSGTDSNKWRTLQLDQPRNTSTVRFEITSFYSDVDVGIAEIEVFGSPAITFLYQNGSCSSDAYYTVTDTNIEECQILCLKQGDICVAFTWLPVSKTCGLLNRACTKYEEEQKDAMTLIKSENEGVIIYEGSCGQVEATPHKSARTVLDCYNYCLASDICHSFIFCLGEQCTKPDEIQEEQPMCFTMSSFCQTRMQGTSAIFDINYYVVHLREPKSPPPRQNYLGCYAKDLRMTNFFENDDSVSIDYCVQTCAQNGYKYAAVSRRGSKAFYANYGIYFGTNCDCGVNYGAGGPPILSENYCNVACNDGQSVGEDCGGQFAAVVYHTNTEPQNSSCVYLTNYNKMEADYNSLSYKMKQGNCDTRRKFICERDYDWCNNHKCQNGGSCASGNNGYNCSCALGYSGSHCQIDTDECASQPCIHGSCLDHANSFSCDCEPNFTGNLCQTEIDICVSEPCANNGTCRAFDGEVVCQCQEGFTGNFCETDIPECLSSPCAGGGTCTEIGNTFTCTCSDGYTGKTCQDEIDECSSSPCQNKGSCLNKVNFFECVCVDGFEGILCEYDVDECLSSPCFNNGSCIDQVNSFFCECVSGYSGFLCESEIDECLSNPCSPPSLCEDGFNSYSCYCADGFGGPDCQIIMGSTTYWAEWGPWSHCSAECGNGGLTFRFRECEATFPALAQWVYCDGEYMQNSSCYEGPCNPVDGQWGPWIPRGQCSVSCGTGVIPMGRSCDSPAPRSGGKNCTGDFDSYYAACYGEPCAENACNQWTDWSSCSTKCGIGSQERSRSCSEVQGQENISVFETEEHQCQGNQCTRTFQCYECSGSLSIDIVKMDFCSGQMSSCAANDGACLYKLSNQGGALHVEKGCSKMADSPSAFSHNCNQFLQAVSREGLLDESELLSALKRINGSCSYSCEGSLCNKYLLPLNVVNLLNSSIKQILYKYFYLLQLAAIYLQIFLN